MGRARAAEAPPVWRGAGGSVRYCRARSRPAAPRPQQVGLDELVDVAVHDRLDVADLEVGAVVLDPLLGVEGVGTDLTAEGDLLLGSGQLGEVFLLLLLGDLVEPGLENPHGGVAI